MIDALRMTPKTPPQSLWPLQAIVAFFIAVKLAFIFGAGPSSDEAYYWLWGQHPALSYYDHPPFHAWLLGLVRLVLGQNLFALRVLTLVTLAGTLWIYRDWARRYAGAEWRPFFWSAAVIHLASGVFGLFFTVAFQDYLFAFLGLVSAHFFILHLSDVAATGRGRLRDLYLGAVLLGLCALTKYSALFFGLALVAIVLSSRDLRPALRSVHLYLAGLLVIAMQAPVLLWNAQHEWASLGFQTTGRHAPDWLLHPSLERIFDFPLTTLLLLSPLLVVPFVRFFLAPAGTRFESVAKRYAVWTFWIASLTLLAASLFDYVNFWWNIPGYVVAMGFAARYMGRVLVYLHAAYGAVLALIFVVSFVVIPIPTLLGRYDYRFTQVYGTDHLEAPIRAAQEKYGTDFIATDIPDTANFVAFALNDPDVTSLTPMRNQYDYWWDPAAHFGQDAIVVINAEDKPDYMATQFRTLTPIRNIDVERFGFFIRGFKLFHGEGYGQHG